MASVPAVRRPARTPLPLRKKILFIAIVAVVFAGLAEIAGFFACRVLMSKLVFYPPERGDFAEYLRMHDPVLGWPAPSRFVEEGRDTAGARLSPAFPDRAASPPAISCYGDSFTWSAEVEDAEAWPEVLSTLIGARIDNFGVGGYGSDQAFLRFRKNREAGVDTAPVVILAHLSENLHRNLTQFRGLISSSTGGLGFKPRFELDGSGDLRLIPLTLPAPKEYEAFIRDPGTVLRNENFLPGSPDGPRVARFPYSLHAALAVTHPRMRAFLSREPLYARYFDPQHPARGPQLTAAIMESFLREATAADRVPVLLIIPTGLDIEYYRARGHWPYQSLVDELAARQVPVLDLGPILDERTRGENLADFFALRTTSRHFNAQGYALVAEAVHEHLRSLGVDPLSLVRTTP